MLMMSRGRVSAMQTSFSLPDIIFTGGQNLNVQHQITSTYLLQKTLTKPTKDYVLILFPHVVSISIQTSLFKGHVTLSAMRFVPHIFYYQTFDNDTIFISVQGPWSALISLDHHSMSLGHLYICC
jgi:hypothetical protein